MDEFGNPFTTATKAADGWVKSFAAIEGGTVTSVSQIVDIILREAATRLADQISGPITDVVSRRQVEEALRKTQTGYAPGPDGITVDFYQLMRTWFVIQLTIFFAKTSLHIQAPIQYKGGSLFLPCAEATVFMLTWKCTDQFCWQMSVAKCQQGRTGSPI